MSYLIIFLTIPIILATLFLARHFQKSMLGWGIASLILGPLALIGLLLWNKIESSKNKELEIANVSSTTNDSSNDYLTFLDGRKIPIDWVDSYKYQDSFHYILKKTTGEHIFWNNSVEITVKDDGEWFCVEWITRKYQPEAIFNGRRAWTNKCGARDRKYYLNELVEYASNSTFNFGIYDPLIIKAHVKTETNNIIVDPQIARKMEVELLEDVVTNLDGNTYHLTPGIYYTKVKYWDAKSGFVHELELCGNEDGKINQSKYDELIRCNKLKILEIISMY